MTFEEFNKLATSRRLRARNCGCGHWQLLDGVCLVNYWQSKRSIYVGGQPCKVRGSPERAIEMALAAGRKKTKSRSRVKRVPDATTDDHGCVAKIAELRAELHAITECAVMWRHAYYGALDELESTRRRTAERMKE